MTFSRIAILGIIIALLVPALATAQDDPGERDTVRTIWVETDPGIDVGVPVEVFNDEDLAGFSLGYTWNSADISVDSVSHIGTRIPPAMMKLLTIDNPAQTVLVGCIDFSGVNSMTPGDGLVFTIWFNVPSGISDQFVDLDSTFIPPAGTFILSPATGGSITPEFFAGQIKIGDPQPPPVIVLDETEFEFNAEVGGGNPTSQILQITNGGGQTLDWTATWNESWLLVTPSSETAPTTVVIAVQTTGLSAGTYVDMIEISAPGATNSPQYVEVTLNLTIPPPTIELLPDSFYFQALQDSANPVGQVMQINNIGAGTLNWTASHNDTWILLSSYGDTAPSSVTIDVDNLGLTAGIYIDSIEVSDPTAVNDPQYAVVVYEIFSAFPMIATEPDTIFAAGSGSTDPYDRVLLIKNNGGGVMVWSAGDDATWMSLDIDTGSTVQGDPSVVMVSFDGSGVSYGKHYGTITISSPNAGNSPVDVPVTFHKMEVPQTLSVSTNSLEFTEVECGSYPGVGSQTFVVSEGIPTPQLHWSLTYSASWLTVTPTYNPVGSIVTVSVDVTGLSPDTYVDTIVVKSDVAVNPPEKVVVTFIVEPTSGTPELGVWPTSLTYIFKYTQVGTSDKPLTIYNVPGGCIDWQASSTVPWLIPMPDTGTTLQQIMIRSDAVGLDLGLHTGQIILTSSVAVNSPLTIDVDLWVYTFGDANGDGIIDVSDVVYIIDYIFNYGPAPVPVPWVGDVNCDHLTDISDAVYLMDWIFNYGPPPCAY